GVSLMKLPSLSSKPKQGKENTPQAASKPGANNPDSTKPDDERLDIDKSNYSILGRLQLLIFAGLFFLFFYSLQFWEHFAHPGAVVRIFGVAVLSALGFLLVGFLLGFIFCIPRTPAKPPAKPATPTPGDAGGHSQDPPADSAESSGNSNEVPEAGNSVE